MTRWLKRLRGAIGIGAGIIVPLTLLGAASASGSLALARRADHGDRLGAGDVPPFNNDDPGHP
jgi:hypothetical protein